MGRARKKEYRDIYLDDKELRKVRKGYIVTKCSGNQLIAVHHSNMDRRTLKKIAKLEAEIKELKAKRK